MKRVFSLFIMISCLSYYCNSQVYFPFKSADRQSSILAYWYNCKADTAIEAAIGALGYYQFYVNLYGLSDFN